MGKAFSMAALLVSTALVAAGVTYWLKPSTNVNVRVTIEEMRNIAELATTEWTMSESIDREFISQGLKKFRSDYVIALVKGKVRGSVDLSENKADFQLSPDDHRVSIHFKPGSVRVSGVEFDPNDPDSFVTISCAQKLPSALGQPATSSQTDTMRKEGIRKIRETAIRKGIVAKTMQNAKQVLGDFCGSLGYQATVTFDDKAYDPEAEPSDGSIEQVARSPR